jgi:hypothetical protein
MCVLHYIEETNPPEVRELLKAAPSFFAGEFAAFYHLRDQMADSVLHLAPKFLLFESPP